MNSIDVLRDGFGRVHQVVHEVADRVGPDALQYRIDPDANTIAWLLWHLTRVQDHHISELAGREQLWVRAGWAKRFGMEADPSATGYGASPEDVARVSIESGELLADYYDAVHDATLHYLDTLGDPDLDEVVDERFDPPVTRGVRLVSVITDDLQHAGQAAYVSGVAERL